MKGIIYLLLRFLATATLALPLTACATLFGLATEGQVLEEGTNKPIPNAIVVLRWVGVVPVIGHASTACVHVESATTDKEGQYRTSAWRAPSTVGPAPIMQTRIGPGASAYKPGYEYVDTKAEVVYLKPFTGTRKERLEYLSFRVISGTSCGSAGESYKNLYRLHRAVYEEAAALAQTPEEKKLAERFKEIADDTLINRSKPTKYDERGRLINVDPKDTFRPEDLK